MDDTVRQKPDLAGLFQIAVGQQGYFTAAQARECGVSKDLVKYHLGTGRFQRAHRGVYRFRDYPPSPREHVAAAWLAVGKDRAVVSHESALDLHELSDVIPHTIDVIVPRDARYLRPPRAVTLHTTTLPPTKGEVMWIDGVRVTSVARTIADAAEAGTAPEQIELAVTEALARGATTAGSLRRAAAGHDARTQRLIGQAIAAVYP